MANRPVIPEAVTALEQFKMEIADELGVDYQITDPASIDNYSAKVTEVIGNAGNIGGEMVKRMIQQAEENMIQNNQ